MQITSTYLLLSCMTPDLESKSSSCSKERPLFANVVAAHNKQRLALCSVGLAHHLDQAGYGIVLQQTTSSSGQCTHKHEPLGMLGRLQVAEHVA